MVAWNGLGKRVAANLLKGDHVLVEGRLVSSTYEQPNAEGKKHTMITSWSIRADVVRTLDHANENCVPDTRPVAAQPEETPF